MKLKAEVEVPENASWQQIEDAKLKAPWRRVVTVDDRMRRTNLEGKCGSCKYFAPITLALSNSKCHGNCLKGRAGYRQRTCKGCIAYERINDDRENTNRS